MKLKPWYSKFGPLSWYRTKGVPDTRLEWIRLDLSFRSVLILAFRWSHYGHVSVSFGGVVHKRSMYGAPSSYEPKMHFSTKSAF